MSEWREFRIEDFGEIQNHKRVPLSAMERAKRQGTYPYYGASGIVDYIDGYLFDGEFVLISEDGENLRTRNTPIAFKASGKFWVNNHAHILKCKRDFMSDLVIYYFKNLDLNEFISGAVQPKLNKSSLTSIPIFLPQAEKEQKAMASVLSSLDDKIDLLHRQNKTLEALAETLFRQWFVEEATEDWEEVSVGSCVKLNFSSIDKSYPHTTIQYLDTGSLTNGKIESLQCLELEEAPSRAKRLVRHNDILISTVRPDQRHFGIIKTPAKDLVVSTGFCVVTCVDIDPHFIYLLLTSDEMTEYLHTIAEGSTSTYPSLKPSDIGSIIFQRPPVQRLKEFATIASYVWEKIEANHIQIRTLENLRNTLLPKLMSGEVRVTI